MFFGGLVIFILMIVLTITRTFSLEHPQVYVGWKELFWNYIYNNCKFVRHFTLVFLGYFCIVYLLKNGIKSVVFFSAESFPFKSKCSWQKSDYENRRLILAQNTAFLNLISSCSLPSPIILESSPRSRTQVYHWYAPWKFELSESTRNLFLLHL